MNSLTNGSLYLSTGGSILLSDIDMTGEWQGRLYKEEMKVTPDDVKKEHIEMCAIMISGRVTWIKRFQDVGKSIPLFCSVEGDKVLFYFNPFRDISYAWLLRDKICLEDKCLNSCFFAMILKETALLKK